MLRSLLAYRLAPCLLLLLVLSARPGEGKDLLDAVKEGILSSLGMEREPRPLRKASEEELWSVYRSYWEKLREMGVNSSRVMAEAEQHSSVLPGKGGGGAISNLSGSGEECFSFQNNQPPAAKRGCCQWRLWLMFH